jgi:hypothetical protein
MIDHLKLHVRDVERGGTFSVAALPPLGHREDHRRHRPFVLDRAPQPKRVVGHEVEAVLQAAEAAG